MPLEEEILQLLDSEVLCLESELKLRMERLNYYEDYTGRSLIQLSDEDKINVEPFYLFPDQIEPSRYYYRLGLSDSERDRLLKEKSELYQKAIEIHSNRAYSADYLEALVYLSLVRTKLLHPQLDIRIHRPHDYIDWLDGHKYRFDDFFTLSTGSYGVQIKNSMHMLFSTSTDLQTFLQTTQVCRPY